MNDSERIANNIKANLTGLRKEKGLTQGEVAEAMNYSDKSVSKWELGDVIPDVVTLQKLADFYGVTLDYLTHEATPETAEAYAKKEDPETKARLERRNGRIFCAICITIVWTVATVTFGVVYSNQSLIRWWAPMALLWGFAPTFMILDAFNSKHHNYRLAMTFGIIAVWCILGCTYGELCTLLENGYNYWYVLFIGIPASALVALFYIFQRNKLTSK
jgi:transcriptional regulator with XRE-family HTH domain